MIQAAAACRAPSGSFWCGNGCITISSPVLVLNQADRHVHVVFALRVALWPMPALPKVPIEDCLRIDLTSPLF